MSKRKSPDRSARARQFDISIKSDQSSDIKGLIKHRASGASRNFDSMLEMVTLLNEKLDDLAIVPKATETRSFKSPPSGQRDEERSNNMTGPRNVFDPDTPLGKPEFLISVMIRQNASWQGRIRWIETGQSIHFRSLLELITLIQEAMEISGMPEADYEFRSWKGVQEELPTGSC